MDVKRHSVKTENAASYCQQYCGQHLWVHGYKLQYFVRRAKYNSRGFVKIYVTIHSPQSFSVMAIYSTGWWTSNRLLMAH